MNRALAHYLTKTTGEQSAGVLKVLGETPERAERRGAKAERVESVGEVPGPPPGARNPDGKPYKRSEVTLSLLTIIGTALAGPWTAPARNLFACGYAARQLGIYTLDLLVPVVPGSPLCRAYPECSELGGLELSLKAGQVGKHGCFLFARDRGSWCFTSFRF